MRLNHLITIGLVATFSGIFAFTGASRANPAEQQTTPAPENLSNLVLQDDIFYKVFFYYGGDYYDQVDQGSQLNTIFGWNAFSSRWKALPLGAFPENQIMESARLVNRVYHDALYQQTSTDPTIRTRDLNNPFDSSLIENPCYTRLAGQPCP
jgi:hypothetical protein